MKKPVDLEVAVLSARNTMAYSSRDWGQSSSDAWLWGILVGWDREAMASLAEKFGWDHDKVERLGLLRAAVRKVTGCVW